jgi:NAD-dependent DNA ligase
MDESFEKEQKLLAEKEQLQQQVSNIKSSYQELKSMVRQSSEQKVQSLMDNLEKKEQEIRSLNQELQKTRAELIMARNKMKSALKELRAAKPLPDEEITAYQPDGKIILVDESLDMVHINLGQKDQIYPGLTFTVYDAGAPISKDGKGKAEIEVFKTKKDISQARIVFSQKPILEGDQIANLVWDSNETNYFVVAGNFDLNKDGATEENAKEKIKKLITDWGGKVTDEVTIETDYIVLGKAPAVPPKPDFEELEIHPRAMEKYEQAVKNLDEYKKVKEQAKMLSIPVFNYERFLYFTGYTNQAEEEGAF